jgi:hypothetical protein
VLLSENDALRRELAAKFELASCNDMCSYAYLDPRSCVQSLQNYQHLGSRPGNSRLGNPSCKMFDRCRVYDEVIWMLFFRLGHEHSSTKRIFAILSGNWQNHAPMVRLRAIIMQPSSGSLNRSVQYL